MTSSTPSRGAATWTLLSLAIGSFGIGMTEFVVMGLLPQISADLLPALTAADPEAAARILGERLGHEVHMAAGDQQVEV